MVSLSGGLAKALVLLVLLCGVAHAGIFSYSDELPENSRILERVAVWSHHDSPTGDAHPYAKFSRTYFPPFSH